MPCKRRRANGSSITANPCTGFHIIIYGQVKLGHIALGGEKVIEIFGPGQSFGEATMFLDRPHIASAHAPGDIMLLHVAKNVVFDESCRGPCLRTQDDVGARPAPASLASDVVEAYSLRRASSVRSATCCAMSPKILQHAGHPGRRSSFPPKGKCLALRLNMTPEHFARIARLVDGRPDRSQREERSHLRDSERLRIHTV